MFENLNQPYPFHNNFKHNLRTISFVSMGFMLISLYFQPFGIDFLKSPMGGYFVLVLGLESAATFFLNTLVLPGIFPKLFDSSKWTIRKEIVWNVSMFAVLITGFTVTALLLQITNLESLTIFRSGALALLPILLFNLVNYNISLKTKVTQVIDSGRHWLAEELKKEEFSNESVIHFESENGKEIFEKELKDIILIQSASNYVEIYFRNETKVQRQIIRQTLSNIEGKLSKYPTIIKCHRCCLVNIQQISKLAGTSPNYTIEAEGLDIKIPVSRQKISELRKLIAKK